MAFNHALLCFSVFSGDQNGFIFFGHALFKMSLGKRAEKLTTVCVPCVYLFCVLHMCHVCLGMAHRLEEVALFFDAGLCFLSFILTIKVTGTYTLES